MRRGRSARGATAPLRRRGWRAPRRWRLWGRRRPSAKPRQAKARPPCLPHAEEGYNTHLNCQHMGAPLAPLAGRLDRGTGDSGRAGGKQAPHRSLDAKGTCGHDGKDRYGHGESHTISDDASNCERDSTYNTGSEPLLPLPDGFTSNG